MRARDFLNKLQSRDAQIRNPNLALELPALLGAQTASEVGEYITASQPPLRSTRAQSILRTSLLNDGEDFGWSDQYQRAIDHAASASLILISHQPTTLPYTGVYAQFILADALRATLESLGQSAIILYLCLDADDAWDRRIRTANIPMPNCRGGSLSLSAELDKSSRQRAQWTVSLSNANQMVANWCEAIAGAYGNAETLLPNRRKDLRKASLAVQDRLRQLTAGLSQNTTSFADWNAQLLRRFVAAVTGNDLPIIRYRTLTDAAAAEFSELLMLWPDVKAAIEHACDRLSKAGIEDVSSVSFTRFPAWLVCKACGLKEPASQHMAIQAISTTPPAISCEHKAGNVGVFPRVILEDMLPRHTLEPTIVLTYAGSAPHVLVTSTTERDLGLQPSHRYCWHPRQQLQGPIDQLIEELGAVGTANDEYVQAAKSLAMSGRDSLVHSLALDQELRYIAVNWQDHFARNIPLANVCRLPLWR